MKKEEIDELCKWFANKEELKSFATKEDLKRFATKEDLKRFATKEDLKRFATKEDLKKFATKKDHNALAKTVSKLVVQVSDLNVRVERIEDNMYTKADHAKFMVWMDEAMTELRASRDERVLSERHILRHDDRLENHEKRITKLEATSKC